DAHYQECLEIGELLGDPDACFRGLKGLVVTARTRGNLPRAESDAMRLVAWALRLQRADFESAARHDLAVIFGLQGRHRESIAEFEEALCLHDGEYRERITMDLAFARAQVGELEQARLTFMSVVESSTDHGNVLLARVNLIQIYGAYGDRRSIDAQ